MELVTERLRLRMWRDEDLEALVALDSDPEVMRFIRDGSTRDRAQVTASFALLRQNWADRGYGLFATELVGSGELVGWVGITVPNFLPEILPAVEIGWRLGRAHWGHGYATEAARAVMAFGFDEVRLDRIVSICHPDNHASRHVMTKLGMAFDRRTTVPAHGGAVDVTAITRQEYAAARGDAGQRRTASTRGGGTSRRPAAATRPPADRC
ncbi:Protein N-acetyltransferase, RimJ/RimL family [Actinacidiphila yanglinensis]|uniref:Protein N-acetyltransferase, RimJ/RimL family n=2 Tax=Actinacidiphila yanglinensis TaxID=310779 RepID=A0A1H6BVR1_9ACTN|nr:Protein N-acetyltransferase, RimJ/RimL family [Actinacidiphila yanglinensis]